MLTAELARTRQGYSVKQAKYMLELFETGFGASAALKNVLQIIPNHVTPLPENKATKMLDVRASYPTTGVVIFQWAGPVIHINWVAG